MSERPDLTHTGDEAPPSDLLDAGLAAAFGPDSGPPLPAAGSVVQALGAIPRVQLRPPSTEAATPHERPTSPGAVGLPPDARLEIHGEIARGGMGAILEGHDADLGRSVAVKVLLESHAGRTELLQRFVEEAQITGQLQHPGVVPVYELGQLTDKRPYFTMKLVKGQTLARLLAERKPTEPAVSAPSDLPRLLKIFEQVCQAVAYAHDRGVIHRDLKPSNVMVGGFGEVQVMDWGLAKVLHDGSTAGPEAPAEDVTEIRTARSTGSEAGEEGDTRTGTVLGTTAYMAPEQARGEVHRVDERADVFGLGAILCEILTGRPPFTGSREVVLRKAQEAELAEAFARLDGCGADAELTALAKWCLAPAAEDRPRDAGVLTAEVSTYREGVEARLRRAELERAGAEVRAGEERKRRKIQAGLAAALLLLAAGGLWLQRLDAARRAEQARVEAERRQGVEAALAKVSDLQGQSRWAEARAVLEEAERRLGEEDAGDLRRRLEQAGTDLDLVGRLDRIRVDKAKIVANKLAYPQVDRLYATAFREAGLAEENEEPDAVATRLRDSAVRPALVAALDDWAATTDQAGRQAWLLAVARAADPDPGGWRNRFRDPAAWSSRKALEQLADDAQKQLDDAARSRQVSPQLLVALEGCLRRRGGDALPLLRRAQARYPTDFWLNYDLGSVTGTDHPEEAVGYYRAALALRPDMPAARHNLGKALYDLRHYDEAIEEFRQAIALDPGHSLAHVNLGSAWHGKGRLEEARAEYEKALELDPKDVLALNNLGNVLQDQGKLDEAAAVFRRAIALDDRSPIPHQNLAKTLREMGKLDDAVAEYKKAIAFDPKYAFAHNGLGNALIAKGQLDDAVAAYRQAVVSDPKYATAHSNLGMALKDKGLLDEAVVECRLAVLLDPHDAAARNNLGFALFSKGRLNDAIAEYREAIRLSPGMAKAHYNLGNAFTLQGRLDDALEFCQKAIKLDPKDALAHVILSGPLMRKGRFEEAVVACRQAVALAPKDAGMHRALGLLLHITDRLDEGIDELQKAAALAPKDAQIHASLGNLLQAKGRFDDAVAAYRKSAALDPRSSDYPYRAAELLRRRGRLDEAVAAYRRVIEVRPDHAEAHCYLGHVLRARGDFVPALAAMTLGHELGSRRLGWTHPSAAWVKQCERLVELDVKLPAVLAGDLRPGGAAERLEYAQVCHTRKLHAAAVRLSADAFAAEPQRADDLKASHRYNAACSAALAGGGAAKDGAKLDDAEKARLREKVHEWLRADLELWTKRLANGKPADRTETVRMLRHWQQDTDLAPVRDKDTLARLPDSEQEQWSKLWADVEALRKKAQESK
jgi:serine/threonine-protein kinase